MDFVGPIIEIVKFVGRPIVRYLKNQIKFKDDLDQFNVSKDHLRSRKRDIESKLDTELHYGKVEREEVRTWLNDAEKFIARPEVADEVNGWGCLSCCCRVKILDKRARELKEIYERGGSYTNECLVKDDPSVSVVELPTTELQGSDVVKAEILACLMGDEVTKLGVWGMGGVGKTTIMKHVHNELLKEGKFKKMIWVTVSQTFDINKLQEQIACSLKEEFSKHENITTHGAALSQMLGKHKPYLLILDDVWRSFKLEDVGIPKPLVSDGCKLVLTTRSQEVARTMDCKIIKVKTLSEGAALRLFIDKVGNIVLSDQGCIKGALEPTLKGIVRECVGLPLAIVTVAGSLKGISEPRLWSAALKQLKDSKRDVASTDDGDAFGVLKFSYDRLKSPKIQHCFLCCALYPEDYRIRINHLIDYWIDEGLIDEMETLQAMKDEGHDILRTLEENCLLESFEDGYREDFVRMRDLEDGYREDCVRMHDLVRDMALQITRTSPRFMVEAGKILTELPEKGKWMEDLNKVSLMRNRIKEIPPGILSSKYRMLTSLLLSNNNLSTISGSFFEHMPALKILDLSFNRKLESLPSSISKLVNLTTLLLQQTSLKEVPSLSELGALKKLNLDWTEIKEVPVGLEMCTNLKYLGLRGFDGILDDAIVLNLSKVQQLFVDMRITLKAKVIGRLKKLEAFSGRFPTVHEWSIFLKCLNGQEDGLSRYFLTIGNMLDLEVWHFTEGFFIERQGWCLAKEYWEKRMRFSGIDIVGEDKILLPSVNGLLIKCCNNLRSLNDFPSIRDATDLRGCQIEKCKGMEFVFSSWINPLIQTLQELILIELQKLKGLFEAEAITMSPPPPPGTFSSLKTIWLEDCRKIKRLITSWKLLGYLQSLEGITVRNCKELEEIIGSDPEEGEEGGDIINLILPKLDSLMLDSLPALKSICSKKAVMVCDSLEYIQIWNCKGLRRIPLYLPLPSLKRIIIGPVELEEWWESLEWDHPNSKDVLEPLLEFL